MEIVQTMLLALFVAFLGFSPPGMINMTALKLSMEQGRRVAVSFVAGASLLIFIQSLIAVTFAKYLGENPQVVYVLKNGAIFVFLGLAFFFFRQAKSKRPLQLKESGKQSFWAGVSMSAMNMLAIPFFLGYSTLLEAKGVLHLEFPLHLFFSLGALAGSSFLFLVYVWFAVFIQKRVQFIARNINYILSLLFLLLAISTVLNTFFNGER